MDPSPRSWILLRARRAKSPWLQYNRGRDALVVEVEGIAVARTDRYAFWKRLKGTGEYELYDVRDDPEQMNNLYGSPDHADVVSDLDIKLTTFFDTYSDVDYDLWRGGTVKGSTDYSRAFKSLYGEDWEAEAKIKPAFEE